MRKLEIDIETYSSADLAKTGVYKYAEAEDFEVLLFGYSVDGGEVKVVDLASGEKMPEEIVRAIEDESVVKIAHNANFERVCLSRFLNYPAGTYLSPSSWQCTMIWAAYLGLPLSLAGVGAVLGLEEQKMKEGKDLIRYFCVPCAPTKANGGRRRNRPEDAPEKWELFKKYNARDVEVEMEIGRKLKNFPVPEEIWEEYRIDQEINDRGVGVDLEMVRNAIEIDGAVREELKEKMQVATALENPNSVQQLSRWLGEQGVETESLGKKQVKKLIEEVPDDVKEVLQLRQQLSKSSVKKYQSMENAACKDGRVRGMFQFYGANRTGRWCLTGDHEVLTNEGWKRLDEWDGGVIACWNAKTEAISFQKAEAVSFDYDGPMYTYQDSRIDQCSTPDHKMRVQRRFGSEWTDMKVEEMAKCRPCIPLTGYRYHRGCANPLWIRVLIMTQADGQYTTDGGVRFHFKKQRKIERCKSLLRKAEIPFVVNLQQTCDCTVISIPARNVPLWLRQFRTKTFGYWLLDENPDIFFDELPNWDGYYSAPNSIQYSTTNKQNADIVQALAHMSGRCCSMTIKHRPEGSNWSDAYVLSIWLTPGNRHEIKVKPTIEDYTGKVYCAVTSTGYFLVRRSGKVWVTGNSGRLVQLHNLPQNHLSDLDEARGLVKSGNMEALEMLYDDIPDTLSQLIRTAFIAPSGRMFYVADFSAIEARVLSWLAGEEWRMKVFEEGGDIYCATASRMFHVPVVKHGENGELRQKGKQCELSCIAEGQMVLTNHGLIPIESVGADDLLWDGEAWVEHEGVIYKGEGRVIEYDGLTATADHIVWAGADLEPVELGFAAAHGLHLIKTGNEEEAVRWDDECGERKVEPAKKVKEKVRLYDICNAGKHHRFTVSGRLVHNCGYGGSVGALKAMGAIESGMQEDELQPLVDAWRSANPKIVQLWWDVDRAAKTAVKERTETETHGIRFTYKSGFLFITLPSGRKLAYVKPRIGENRFGGESITYEGAGGTKKWERVESYGPKYVENIVQALSRDILCYAMRTLSDLPIVMHVHDELVIECPEGTSLEEICEKMGRTPPWTPGLVLRADGFVTKHYKKD